MGQLLLGAASDIRNKLPTVISAANGLSLHGGTEQQAIDRPRLYSGPGPRLYEGRNLSTEQRLRRLAKDCQYLFNQY